MVDFSEQNLIDCVGIGDCNNGFPELGLYYFLNNGLNYNSDYSSYTESVNIVYII